MGVAESYQPRGAMGPQAFSTIVKREHYLGFRYTGIQYGPRFRCCDWVATKTSKVIDITDDEEVLAYSVLNIQSDAEGWERQLKFNPSILDCALQSQAALGRTDVAAQKKALKAEKTKGGKKK